jgi:hypothetical protein
VPELLAPVPYTTPEGVGGDDEPLLIERNSLLGQFLRRCILAFNILSFEVINLLQSLQDRTVNSSIYAIFEIHIFLTCPFSVLCNVHFCH